MMHAPNLGLLYFRSVFFSVFHRKINIFKKNLHVSAWKIKLAKIWGMHRVEGGFIIIVDLFKIFRTYIRGAIIKYPKF